MPTIYVTKHALTTGTIERMDDCVLTPSGTCATYEGDNQDFLFYVLGRDACLTEEAAKARAVEMAQEKLTYYSRESDKLRDLIAKWSDGQSSP